MKFLRTTLLAVGVLALASCSGYRVSKTATAGAIGSVLGAGVGAIVGSQTGHVGPGAAVGAATGLLAGAYVGQMLEWKDEERDVLDEQYRRQQEQILRQRREIEDLKRQQRYDEQYRHY